ncbi:glycosyltransferase [Butyrivibrio sp. NC3005]|uniref:glycosyltransferase n=1 Tax=Butyrivibrio sp. NC3005 TaxID=1280685 RepID=UPI0003F6B101|nr:glycosyltransferase [Butyrivibrio sp. NC3005]
MLHPNRDKFSEIIFRNDDVSADTSIVNFIKFCDIFHKFGFVQTHGIVLWGKCNNTTYFKGEGWIYDEITPIEYHEYNKCVSVSNVYIGDNKELISYLNDSPDFIALHGLYHSDYSCMSYDQQEKDITEGLKLLKELFPKKKVSTFIAPFNKTNEYTYEICRKFGLRVSALEGEHLELRISQGKGPLYDNELYRYHHHRFYDDSTFNSYKLSINVLEEYFKKYSFTYNLTFGKAIPSNSMKHALESENSSYSEDEFVNMYIENLLLIYLNKKDRVIVDGKNMGLIHRLWYAGYEQIVRIDNGDNEFDKKLSHLLKSNIIFSESIDALDKCKRSIKSIIFFWEDKNLKLDIIIDRYVKIMDKIGYFFLVTNTNEDDDEIINSIGKYNMLLASSKIIENKKVFLLKRYRPQICILCDRRNWAFDYTAREIKHYLSDEFDIDINYVVDNNVPDVNNYDIFHVCFWGEELYKKDSYSKSRIIKQVASHRWQFDKPYGPMTVQEFYKQWLSDADTINCPSLILYNLLRQVCKNIFLCSEGYDHNIFKYLHERKGEMVLCSVGHLNDPVKGVNDLLIPSCKGYTLKTAEKLNHLELCKFYNDSDIYVISSKHESNPLPLIESMACGCFPISTNIGIAPEVIRHKENGYIVEKRDIASFRAAYEWCAEHLSEIRHSAYDRSEEMYKNRRWQLLAENYRNMYRDHISRR